MRHLGSLVVALAVGPLMLVLGGRGLTGLVNAATAERPDYLAITFAAAELVVAGLIFALLAMARYSPLGPALVGMGCLALAGWSLVDPARLRATIPIQLIGGSADQLATTIAVAPLFGVPLVLTLFSPRRWRGYDAAAAAVAAADHGLSSPSVRDTRELPTVPLSGYPEPARYPPAEEGTTAVLPSGEATTRVSRHQPDTG